MTKESHLAQPQERTLHHEDVFEVAGLDIERFPELAQQVLAEQEDNTPARLIDAWVRKGFVKERQAIEALYILAIYDAGTEVVEELKRRMLE